MFTRGKSSLEFLGLKRNDLVIFPGVCFQFIYHSYVIFLEENDKKENLRESDLTLQVLVVVDGLVDAHSES